MSFPQKIVDCVACTMVFCTRGIENTLTESVRSFIFTRSYSQFLFLQFLLWCLRLQCLFLEHFQPAISTVFCFLFSVSVYTQASAIRPEPTFSGKMESIIPESLRGRYVITIKAR